MMRLPFWHGSRRLSIFSETLLRHELAARIARQDWDPVRELCRRLAYYNNVVCDGDQGSGSVHRSFDPMG